MSSAFQQPCYEVCTGYPSLASSADGTVERNPWLPVNVREPRHSLRHYSEFRFPRAWKMDARPQRVTGSLAGGNLRR